MPFSSDPIFLPHPRLRPYIAYYRLDEKQGVLERSMPRRIVPDGNSHLLFYIYGDHSDVLSQPYSALSCSLRYVGARSVYKDIDQRRRARTLSVRFRPGGAVSFLQASAPAFTDASFSLDLLWGQEGVFLLEQLAEAQEAEAQVRVLDQTFLRKLVTATPMDRVVQGALRQMKASQPPRSLKALAASLGVTDRCLRHRFQQAVGLSPKTYLRIVRTNQLIETALNTPSPNWSSLALEAGFYDQAHMIHDVQALFGESPVAFLQRF